MDIIFEKQQTEIRGFFASKSPRSKGKKSEVEGQMSLFGTDEKSFLFSADELKMANDRLREATVNPNPLTNGIQMKLPLDDSAKMEEVLTEEKAPILESPEETLSTEESPALDMPKEIHEDFGEVITGSKKALWGGNRLNSSEVECAITDMDLDSLSKVTKTLFLKSPTRSALEKEGAGAYELAFKIMAYQSLPNAPTNAKNYTECTIRELWKPAIPLSDILPEYVAVFSRITSSSLDKIFELSEEITDEGSCIAACGEFYDYVMDFKSIRFAQASTITKATQKKLRTLKNSVLQYIRKFDLYDSDERFVKNDWYVFESVHAQVDLASSPPLLKAKYDEFGSKYQLAMSIRNAEDIDTLKKATNAPNSFLAIPVIDSPRLELEGNIFSAKSYEDLIDILSDKKKNLVQNEKKSSKKKASSKKGYKQPHLDSFELSSLWDSTMNATGDDILETFGLRGGQFGNYVSSASERQEFLNLTYDAFMVLSKVLEWQPKRIGLMQSTCKALGIAFGARGGGNALAHYEPMERVVNLTRKKGGGSLAHEWAHGCDDAYNRPSDNALSSGDVRHGEEFTKFMADIAKNCPKFTSDAEKLDGEFKKSGNGYWSSDVEKFARLFAYWVEARSIEMGIHSSFLSGHAICPPSEIDGDVVSIFPDQKEEQDYVCSVFPAFMEMIGKALESR